MSDTPRTDEAWDAVSRTPDGRYATGVPLRQYAFVMCEHSKQLERELAEVRKQRDILETALMIIEGYYVHNESTYEDWKAMGQTAKNALSRITPI